MFSLYLLRRQITYIAQCKTPAVQDAKIVYCNISQTILTHSFNFLCCITVQRSFIIKGVFAVVVVSSSRCLFTCFKVSILVYKTCVAWIVSSPYMKMILLAKFPSAASSIFPSYCVGILFYIFNVCCLGTNGGVLKSQCSRV